MATMINTMMLTTAARLRSRRRQASTHRLRPLTSSTLATMGGRAASVMAKSVVADPGIQDAVDQIHGQVGEDDEHAVEDRHPHHQRVVPVQRRLDEIAADTGNAEDLLDHDRTGNRIDDG